MQTTSAKAPRSTSNGFDLTRVRLQARQVNVPWVVLGVLIVVGSGLAFAVWASSLADRIAVLAVARDLPAGAELRFEDLAVTEIGVDDTTMFVTASRRDEIVGKTLRTDLSAGVVLSPDLVGDGPAVEPGTAVLGLALAPGAVPIDGLRPGDPILAVRTPPAGAVDTQEGQAEAAGTATTWEATVFAVTSLDDGATSFVSLRVARSDAPAIAAAAALEQIRLVLVHDTGTAQDLGE